MKRSKFAVITCFLLISFFFANFSTAHAKKIENSLPVPTVNSISGDKEFKVDPISISDLPGTTALSNGMLVPAGFGNGEKQFSGNALNLSGLEYGYVNVCFAFSAANQGWGGKVGYWNGSAWKLLETTISHPAESIISWGCASTSTNGQYAFLQWVVDASLLPKASSSAVPECDFALYGLTYDWLAGPSFSSGWVTGLISTIRVISPNDLNGRAVKVTFVGANPSGSYLLDSSSGNLLIANDQMTYDSGSGNYVISLISPTNLQMAFSNISATLLFDFGTCVQTVTIGGS